MQVEHEELDQPLKHYFLKLNEKRMSLHLLLDCVEGDVLWGQLTLEAFLETDAFFEDVRKVVIEFFFGHHVLVRESQKKDARGVDGLDHSILCHKQETAGGFGDHFFDRGDEEVFCVADVLYSKTNMNEIAVFVDSEDVAFSSQIGELLAVYCVQKVNVVVLGVGLGHEQLDVLGNELLFLVSEDRAGLLVDLQDFPNIALLSRNNDDSSGYGLDRVVCRKVLDFIEVVVLFVHDLLCELNEFFVFLSIVQNVQLKVGIYDHVLLLVAHICVEKLLPESLQGLVFLVDLLPGVLHFLQIGVVVEDLLPKVNVVVHLLLNRLHEVADQIYTHERIALLFFLQNALVVTVFLLFFEGSRVAVDEELLLYGDFEPQHLLHFEQSEGVLSQRVLQE